MLRNAFPKIRPSVCFHVSQNGLGPVCYGSLTDAPPATTCDVAVPDTSKLLGGRTRDASCARPGPCGEVWQDHPVEPGSAYRGQPRAVNAAHVSDEVRSMAHWQHPSEFLR